MNDIQQVEPRVRAMLEAAQADGMKLLKHCAVVRDANNNIIGRCLLCVIANWGNHEGYTASAAKLLDIEYVEANRMISGWDSDEELPEPTDRWVAFGMRLARDFAPIRGYELRAEASRSGVQEQPWRT